MLLGHDKRCEIRVARIVEWRQQDTTSNKEGRIDGCKGWDRQW